MAVSAVGTGANDSSVGLIPDRLKWDGKTFLTQTVEGVVENGKVVKPARFDSVTFREAGLDGRPGAVGSGTSELISEEAPLGVRIRSLVEDSLARAFGYRGGPPDFDYLSKVFQGKDRGILKGKLKVDPAGREQVQYYWESPADWIGSIRRLVQGGNRLKVNLAVIWVYQDKHSRDRYWAVVKQGWETLDPGGRKLYRDDGFLFLNFDLDGKHNPCNLSVRYRLWFYNYKNPDARTGLKRYQLIARDIRGALDEKADAQINMGHLEGDRWVPDAGKRGLSGVDRSLLERMTNDLVGGIREATGE